MCLDIDSSLQTNESTLLMTRLHHVMSPLWFEEILDDTDSTLSRRACDSESTKVTQAHHSKEVISKEKLYSFTQRLYSFTHNFIPSHTGTSLQRKTLFLHSENQNNW